MCPLAGASGYCPRIVQGYLALQPSEGPGLISCDFAMCSLAGASGYRPRIVQGYLALQPSEGPGLISCDFAMCPLAGASGYCPRIVQGYLESPVFVRRPATVPVGSVRQGNFTTVIQFKGSTTEHRRTDAGNPLHDTLGGP